MRDVTAPLTLDFLRSLLAGPRPYREVMEAWRTSCPRLTVWEDALDAGLVERLAQPGEAPAVSLTERGRAHLATADALVAVLPVSPDLEGPSLAPVALSAARVVSSPAGGGGRPERA